MLGIFVKLPMNNYTVQYNEASEGYDFVLVKTILQKNFPALLTQFSIFFATIAVIQAEWEPQKTIPIHCALFTISPVLRNFYSTLTLASHNTPEISQKKL